MEEIGTSLNQSMAEIFETQSPMAKKINELNKQIEQAKPLLNEIKTGKTEFVIDFLKIFYKGTELNKQIKRVEKRNELELITSLYSVLASRMDRLDQIKDELKEITEI